MSREDRPRRPRKPRGDRFRPPKMEPEVKEAIAACESDLHEGLAPSEIKGFNAFQRKQVYRYFEKSQEYGIKTHKRDDDYVIKIYPTGNLKRLAEQKAQEVLMTGDPIALPPMGSYERFVVHDYLKDRGVSTESHGEGDARHIEIQPVFGRNLKKAKKRLI